MYKYQIYTDMSLAVVQFSNSVTKEEVFEYFTEIGTDERYQPTFSGIVDLRGSDIQLKANDLAILAEAGSKNSTAKWVLLVTDPRNTAFSLLYKEVLDHSHPLAVVCEEQSASDFLGFDIVPFLIT